MWSKTHCIWKSKCAISLSNALHCLQHYNVARLVWNIGIYGCHSNILRKPWSEMVGENDFIHHYSFGIQRKNGRLVIQSSHLDYKGNIMSCKWSGCVVQVNRVSVKQNFKGTWAWIHCTTRWIIKTILLFSYGKIFLSVPSKEALWRRHKIHFDTKKTCMCLLVFGKESITVIFFSQLGVCLNLLFFYWCFARQMIKQPKDLSRVHNIIETRGWALNAASMQLPRTH